jgi:hypothetical protein
MPFGSSVAGICAHAVVGAVTRFSEPREMVKTSSARTSIPAALLAASNSLLPVVVLHPLNENSIMLAATALRADAHDVMDFMMLYQ